MSHSFGNILSHFREFTFVIRKLETRRSRWGPSDRVAEGGAPRDKRTIATVFGYISGKLTSRGDAPKSANKRETRGEEKERG